MSVKQQIHAAIGGWSGCADTNLETIYTNCSDCWWKSDCEHYSHFENLNECARLLRLLGIGG